MMSDKTAAVLPSLPAVLFLTIIIIYVLYNYLLFIY